MASYSSARPTYREFMGDLESIEKAWKAESNGAHSGVLAVAMTAPVTAEPAELPCRVNSPELCPSISHPDQLTRMVVMMSVLFASVSETLISRLVEFMARVLLEYQIPI